MALTEPEAPAGTGRLPGRANQVDRRADVEANEVLLVRQRNVDERPAVADPGIEPSSNRMSASTPVGSCRAPQGTVQPGSPAASG